MESSRDERNPTLAFLWIVGGVWLLTTLARILHNLLLVQIAPAFFVMTQGGSATADGALPVEGALWSTYAPWAQAVLHGVLGGLGPGLLLGAALFPVTRLGRMPVLAVRTVYDYTLAWIGVIEALALGAGLLVYLYDLRLYPASLYPAEAHSILVAVSIQVTAAVVGTIATALLLLHLYLMRRRAARAVARDADRPPVPATAAIDRWPRPTRAGRLAIFFVLLGMATGLQTENNVLFFLACLPAGLLVVAYLRNWVNLRGLTVERQAGFPIHAGTPFENRLTLKNAAPRRAALVCVEDFTQGEGSSRLPLFSAVAEVPARGSARSFQQGVFHLRGEKSFTHLRLGSTYPLGLFRAERILGAEQGVVVYPRLRRLAERLLPNDAEATWERTMPVRAAMGEEQFAGLREWRPGDSPKWIHWRSSARADGKLLVKEFEGSALKRVRVVLEVRACEAEEEGTRRGASRPRGDRRVERAIELAASLARMLASRRFVARFHLRAAEEQVIEVRPHDRSLFSLFHALALAAPVATVAGGDWPRDLPVIRIRPRDLEPGRRLEEEVSWSM